MIPNPFFRIFRPGDSQSLFIDDSRYANDRRTSVAAFKIIENDFKELLCYIEPSDANKLVFSHRLYELLLRAATEFESNCKKILKSNSYAGTSRDWNIMDYFKISAATKLNEFQIKINIWDSPSSTIEPFKTWNTSVYQPLEWYKGYNAVKHNRQDNFNCANLENVTSAISAVYIMLFAQFDIQAMASYNDISSHTIDDEDFLFQPDSIFSIKCPNWNPADNYLFDWNILKNEPNPFRQYIF